ncbi:MAG: hypothetical protein JWR08_2684 [Enterovirga sp.]|nr:hypothetical protein [Enterovirga sp.]
MLTGAFHESLKGSESGGNEDLNALFEVHTQEVPGRWSLGPRHLISGETRAG